MYRIIPHALLATVTACSSASEQAGSALAQYGCDWNPGPTYVVPVGINPGGCWYDADPNIALTPDWVTNPCEVDSMKRDNWQTGESLRIWKRTYDSINDRPVFLSWKANGCDE